MVMNLEELIDEILKNFDEKKDAKLNECFNDLYNGEETRYLEEDPYDLIIQKLKDTSFLNEDEMNKLIETLITAKLKREAIIKSCSSSRPFPSYEVIKDYINAYYDVLKNLLLTLYHYDKALSDSVIADIINIDIKDKKALMYSPYFLGFLINIYDCINYFFEKTKNLSEDVKKVYHQEFLNRLKFVYLSGVIINNEEYMGVLSEGLSFDLILRGKEKAKIDSIKLTFDIMQKLETEFVEKDFKNLTVSLIGKVDFSKIQLLDYYIRDFQKKYNKNFKVNINLYSSEYDNNNFKSDIIQIANYPEPNASTISKIIDKSDILYVFDNSDLYYPKYKKINLSPVVQQFESEGYKFNNKLEIPHPIASINVFLRTFLKTSRACMGFIEENPSLPKISFILNKLKTSSVGAYSLYYKDASYFDLGTDRFIKPYYGYQIYKFDSSASEPMAKGCGYEAIYFSLLDIFKYYSDVITLPKELINNIELLRNTIIKLDYKDWKNSLKLSFVTTGSDKEKILIKTFLQQFCEILQNINLRFFDTALKTRFNNIIYFNSHTLNDILFYYLICINEVKLSKLEYLSNEFDIERYLGIKNYCNRSAIYYNMSLNEIPSIYSQDWGTHKYIIKTYEIMDYYYEEALKACYNLGYENSTLKRNLKDAKEGKRY